MFHVKQLVVATDIETGRLCLLLSIIACWLAAEKWVIPSHFNKSFHMTVSELDETWYASSTFGFVMSDKISLSFIVWFPG